MHSLGNYSYTREAFDYMILLLSLLHLEVNLILKVYIPEDRSTITSRVYILEDR